MKKLSRNPDVNWRVESGRETYVREVLEDPSRTEEDAGAMDVGTVTILSGGVMHQLNLLGGEIWKLCDGSLDRPSLVGHLLDLFDVDEDTLRSDADAFIDEMMNKGLLHEK
ncbi:MAG: PqqD family peptide modification chaperone [bacterium]|nr:MAG: PqqD family peptide modification chaperone [bacterium]